MGKLLRITGITLLTLMIVAVVGMTCMIGYQSANGMLYQNQGKDTHYASEWQLEQWAYDQETFESAYKIESFVVEGLEGYEIPVKKLGSGQGTNSVIMVHGAGGDYLSTYPQAEVYLKNGWDVYAIDQRGSGDSKDDRVTFGILEKEDLACVVNEVRSETKGKLVVHGISMGAATAGLYTGMEGDYEMPDAVIMDSSYDSMENAYLSVWNDMETGLPGGYGLWCANIFLRLGNGIHMADGDVTNAMAHNRVPTLIIQGEKDQLCTVDMGEALYEAIPHKNKTYWLVDSEHIDACIDDPEAYEHKVMGFINENIAVSK